MRILLISLVLLSFVSCAGIIMDAMKSVPSQEEVAAMKVGETKYEDVIAKWTSYKKQIMNNNNCLMYHKANAAAHLGVVGGDANMVYLCFKDGLLVSKQAH
ncbi:MAG: hypothetical protein HN353_13105 [Bdellovibrionales bacterium]|jgi:hypothetical protein|nr:hypothetical protein [Bdellovibrionales bacterium]MBT3524971.1 hypothetical protein [Bdellovibrionales bacterium]MBT7670355.1 hypothetical protein [Bdellovibrionales bacterium]MBT7766673.1 hypothetical protein [Bdellovibrionales bacterium]